MKKYLSMIVASVMLVSCVDTIILPDDKTVEEDFWKSKSDVQLIVNNAYRSMTFENVISRLIVWGDLRSDELIPIASVTGSLVEDLTEINLGNTQEDNAFVTWGDFYSVINYCNLVLGSAEAVMQEDPSYTQGDYLADCSQMLALRSLCYFYLVRNFRDVPYVTQAFKESSQERDIAQASPDSVLTCCISDLETAEKNAIQATAYTDWRRVGYFTRDAIDALLADIYLWRASVKHSASDYEQAIAYCNKVIASKKSQHVMGFGETEMPDYPLTEGRKAFIELYVVGNAEESILELQFDGSSNPNSGNGHYFGFYNGKDGYQPYLYASDIFKYEQTVYKTGTYSKDWRGWENTYATDVNVGDFTGALIRKYIGIPTTVNTTVIGQVAKNDTRSYGNTIAMNYIFYRLADIMLMKAEAITALVTQNNPSGENISDEDTQRLQEAFELVEKVNTRSRETTLETIKWNTYNTPERLENLILDERLRELAFEGKRWYDLMRYSYRHYNDDGLSTPVDYTTTLANQHDRNVTLPTVYQPMLDLMKRKLGAKGNAVAAKINNEARLYLPISLTELKVSPSLRQNPAYSTTDDYSKNY